MLDKMGGGLPVMAALLFLQGNQKRAASKLLLLFFSIYMKSFTLEPSSKILAINLVLSI